MKRNRNKKLLLGALCAANLLSLATLRLILPHQEPESVESASQIARSRRGVAGRGDVKFELAGRAPQSEPYSGRGSDECSEIPVKEGRTHRLARQLRRLVFE